MHANVQMTTKGNGRVMAQFEFELKNQTTSSQLDLLASGEVNLKVNHGDTRDTSQFRSSFSQLHGQDGSVDESDCPTTPKEKQWEQNVTMVDEYSSIDATANIVKPEEESVIGPMVVPGKGCCSGKVAEEKGPVTVSSASLELTPPAKPQPPPLNYVRRARERRALREREANALGDEMNGRDREARLEERNQNGAGIRDDP